MTFVDGFLGAVPTANKDAYLEMARDSAAVFKEHGALSVVECWGVDVPEGATNSMHTAVMREEDETVVFSWIIWPSKAARDDAMPKMMQDERLTKYEGRMPFDGKRLIFGGFEPILEA